MKVANYRTMNTSHESHRLLLLLLLHMQAADQLASRKRAPGHPAFRRTEKSVLAIVNVSLCTTPFTAPS
jgi:hypothetical protein